MSFNMRLEEIAPSKTDAFPDHDFKHKFVIVDDNDKPTGQEWIAGQKFNWQESLLPPKPDSDWFAFIKDINSLIDDAKHFRENEIPRLQKKEEALAKKVEDLSFHLEVRKKDLGTTLNRNIRNRSAYYTLRDYEARFNLLHGLAQLTQVQSQIIDLITACIIRRVQARMRWLVPLFCKVGMRKPDGPIEKLNEMVDEEPYFEMYVWHPYSDDNGNIMEEYLDIDAMRDYPLILQQVMDPAKYRTLVLEKQKQAKAAAEAKARGDNGKIIIADKEDERSVADFHKKFGDQLGGLGKK